MKTTVRTVILVFVLFVLVSLVTGCNSPAPSVVNREATSVDTSGVWIGNNVAAIPIGDANKVPENPKLWVSAIDRFEEQRKVRVTSWSVTEWTTPPGQWNGKLLLVTFIREKR